MVEAKGNNTLWIHKTITANGDTVASFRTFLADFGLDLLANPIDIARIAPIWASTRLPARLRNDGTPNKRHQGDVSNSTYNQRLAILSSWYTFVQEVYKLDIANPVKDVARCMTFDPHDPKSFRKP